MKPYNSGSLSSEVKTRAYICSLLVSMSLLSTAFFIGSSWLGKESLMMQISPGVNGDHYTSQYPEKVNCEVLPVSDIGADKTKVNKCNDQCRRVGTEALPKGIVTAASNLEMQPLSGPISNEDSNKHKTSLLAMAVGFKQRRYVKEIVEKFLEEGFAVMLFHYDGIVDEWREMEWSDAVIHVSAMNQTKWWFAKRFLHPDIVTEYDHIFLWDEDLGVENFHPRRYLRIIEEEGFEISQPGLDPHNSEVHHRITIRNQRSRVHRRYYKLSSGGSGRCDGNSTAPPCVGWVEMMAPVFSRAAWRCVWHMIQNDLIHAWGLDKQLGYCAQGDRTVKVGVVDEEYVVHWGLPTLGGDSDNNKANSGSSGPTSSAKKAPSSESVASSKSSEKRNNRLSIRQRSYAEMRAFNNRWKNAVEEDECWVDPFGSNS